MDENIPTPKTIMTSLPLVVQNLQRQNIHSLGPSDNHLVTLPGTIKTPLSSLTLKESCYNMNHLIENQNLIQYIF